MGSSQIRRLLHGDEPLAELACRTFGLEGDIDPTAFLMRPETALLNGNGAAVATYASAGGSTNGGSPAMFTWRLGPGRHSD